MKNTTKSETVIAATDIEAAIESIRAARQGMTFLTALTPKERQSATRITPSSLALMEVAVQAARENSGILPASMALAEYTSEVQACRGLFTLLQQLQELCSDVQDTLASRGREAAATTQQVRVILKTVAKTKPTPGLKLLVQRLNPRTTRPAESPAADNSAQPVAAAVPVDPPVPTPVTTPPSDTKAA